MIMKITSNIYYVGVNDRNKHRFEGLWPLPNGVSYNSYIIDDEKVALVDTVEVDFFTQYLENIHEVIATAISTISSSTIWSQTIAVLSHS